jgi:hypothetical protein
MTCPKCDGPIDALATKLWGRPEGPTPPLAPFICASCGSILVIMMADKTILTPEEIKARTGLDAVAMMRKNPRLWPVIEKERDRILALPNRRRVLR